MEASDTGPFGGPALVLMLAHPDDPVAIGFSKYASGRGLEIWQPKHLDDIAWSYKLDYDVEFCDRSSGRRWQSCELAGIWFQSWPPLTTIQNLGERDRRYVLAELNSSMRAIWNAAQCVAIGHTWTVASIIDFGLESRIELRRLGLPTLVDHIGSFQFLRTTLATFDPEHVWITRTQGGSAWLSDMLTDTRLRDKLDFSEDELMAATVTDNRHACAVLHVGADVLVVKIEGDTMGWTSPQEKAKRALPSRTKSITQSLRALTGAPVGVTYFARQQERWKVARMSLQIPHWLNDSAACWLYPRLVNVFTNSNRDRPDTSSAR